MSNKKMRDAEKMRDANEMRNASERRIAEALCGLRALSALQPPADFHNRILGRLQSRERARDAARVRLWRRFLAGPVVAALAAVALIATAGWAQHEWSSAAATAAHVAQAESPGRSVQIQTQPRSFEPATLAQPKRVRAYASRRSAPRPALTPVSYPAPLAPLTHEEHLLLQLAEVHSPFAAPAVEALLRSETVSVPGIALPTFDQAMNTGDQP